MVALARCHGIGKTEVLVAMSITAILAGIAVPSFAALQRSSHLASATNSLASALNLTRSEAVRRASAVTIGATAGSGNFSQGWEIWIDTNRNGTRDGGEELIVIESSKVAGTLIDQNALNTLVFTSSGALDISGAASRVLRLCTGGGGVGRELYVNSLGRIASKPYTCPTSV